MLVAVCPFDEAAMNIIDISRTLAPGTAVWPGDQPFVYTWAARLDEGETVNLSTIQMSSHAGTHLDAPLHYLPQGASVDEIPLLQLAGPCLVIEAKEASCISPDTVAVNDELQIPRLLFKTNHSDLSDTEWSDDVAFFEVATIERMAEQGVILIGTDAPSVDSVDSKSLDAHKALARHGIVNLENLSLMTVEPGMYQLVALPLKVMGLDAAPVRAILIDERG